MTLTPAQLKEAASINAAANGRKGGRNRALALTAKQRKDIARNAAKARWGKG